MKAPVAFTSAETVNDDTGECDWWAGVDVLFGTSNSSDFRYGEIAVTSGTVALEEHLVDTVALEEHLVDTVLGL